MAISTLLVSTEQGHRSATRANSSQAGAEKEEEEGGEETRVEAGRRRKNGEEKERWKALSLGEMGDAPT